MRARNMPGTLFMLVLAASQWRLILTLTIVVLVTAAALRVLLGRLVRRGEWLARRLERRPVVVTERHYHEQRDRRSR